MTGGGQGSHGVVDLGVGGLVEVEVEVEVEFGLVEVEVGEEGGLTTPNLHPSRKNSRCSERAKPRTPC